MSLCGHYQLPAEGKSLLAHSYAHSVLDTHGTGASTAQRAPYTLPVRVQRHWPTVTLVHVGTCSDISQGPGRCYVTLTAEKQSRFGECRALVTPPPLLYDLKHGRPGHWDIAPACTLPYTSVSSTRLQYQGLEIEGDSDPQRRGESSLWRLRLRTAAVPLEKAGVGETSNRVQASTLDD